MNSMTILGKVKKRQEQVYSYYEKGEHRRLSFLLQTLDKKPVLIEVVVPGERMTDLNPLKEKLTEQSFVLVSGKYDRILRAQKLYMLSSAYDLEEVEAKKYLRKEVADEEK